MNKRINPTGLKGKKDITNRMVELMGLKETIKETPVHSIKLTKKGPDGKAYGIVKENNKYFIKCANLNEDGLVSESFNYIGGLENKIKESYSSYSKATKMLQHKFNEIAKVLNTNNKTNVLRNDNLLIENYSGVAMNGISPIDISEEENMEDLYEITEITNETEEEQIDEKLDVVGQEDCDVDNDGDVDNSDEYIKTKRDAITKSMNEIDELYESIIGKKKSLN